MSVRPGLPGHWPSNDACCPPGADHGGHLRAERSATANAQWIPVTAITKTDSKCGVKIIQSCRPKKLKYFSRMHIAKA